MGWPSPYPMWELPHSEKSMKRPGTPLSWVTGLGRCSCLRCHNPGHFLAGTCAGEAEMFPTQPRCPALVPELVFSLGCSAIPRTSSSPLPQRWQRCRANDEAGSRTASDLVPPSCWGRQTIPSGSPSPCLAFPSLFYTLSLKVLMALQNPDRSHSARLYQLITSSEPPTGTWDANSGFSDSKLQAL